MKRAKQKARKREIRNGRAIYSSARKKKKIRAQSANGNHAKFDNGVLHEEPVAYRTQPLPMLDIRTPPDLRPVKVVREDNKLKLNDRAAHQWYRFVLSFPPHLVREYIAKFGLTSRHQVLDPFCGTGTTIVECKKLGIPAVGFEPNPMACFASKTKLKWNVDPQGLLRHALAVAETATISTFDADVLKSYSNLSTNNANCDFVINEDNISKN